MKLEQNISKGYEPIEPESNKEKLRGLTKKLAPWIAGYAVFTVLATATMISDLQSGKTKRDIEKEFHSGQTLPRKVLDYSLNIISKPQRELGCFLYDKGFRIIF